MRMKMREKLPETWVENKGGKLERLKFSINDAKTGIAFAPRGLFVYMMIVVLLRWF